MRGPPAERVAAGSRRCPDEGGEGLTPAANRLRIAFDRCVPTSKGRPSDRREPAEEAVSLGRRRNTSAGVNATAGARQLA
jgi:hypothetical protein